MNLLSLIQKALCKSFQSKLKMNENDARNYASKIITESESYKISTKEQKEIEVFDLLFSYCNKLQYFIEGLNIKNIDTISILANQDKYEMINKSYNNLCFYEKSYKKYKKEILKILDYSNIGNRTSLGQFLLHPSEKYSYYENIIIKAYLKGIRYWNLESKYMSQEEEQNLKYKIDKISSLYPFIKKEKT